MGPFAYGNPLVTRILLVCFSIALRHQAGRPGGSSMMAIQTGPVAGTRRKVNRNRRAKPHKLRYVLILGVSHRNGLQFDSSRTAG